MAVTQLDPGISWQKMTETLSKTQVEFYTENGYLVLEQQVPASIIGAIRDEIARFEDIARAMTESDDKLDLEDSHTPDEPRLRRIKLPHTQSAVVRDLMYSDHILAPVRDLLGPNLRLHTTKLNMKKAGYGAAVQWHQDCAFYPHTNDDLLAVGVLIDDMETVNGPLMVFPGSHRGPIYDHHVEGVFAGGLRPESVGLDMKAAVSLTGPSGSISIHHGRILHGSAVNRSARSRRLLFYEIMAADAFPIMGSLTAWNGFADYNRKMLCGETTVVPRLENIPVRIPQPQPDVAMSIYELQKGMKERTYARIDSDKP